MHEKRDESTLIPALEKMASHGAPPRLVCQFGPVRARSHNVAAQISVFSQLDLHVNYMLKVPKARSVPRIAVADLRDGRGCGPRVASSTWRRQLPAWARRT
jgi:hypothetical protein